MNPSYLYHAFGVRHQECTKTEYKGNQNIHYIQTRKDELCCPECKSRKIIRSGSIYRDIRSVPVGHRATILALSSLLVRCLKRGLSKHAFNCSMPLATSTPFNSTNISAHFLKVILLDGYF